MKITKRAKLVTGAAALAGVVALTGGAFTAGGVTSDAGATQFIGGEVTQSVTGAATLDSIDYTFTDVSNTEIDSVKVTFSAISAGSAVAVELNGSGADVSCVADTGTVGVEDFDCAFAGDDPAVASLEVKVTAA